MTETITAISTPIVEGAIGIIRISGEDSFEIINKIFKSKFDQPLKDKTLVYGHIKDGDQIIDEVLVSIMEKPHTYTTEDMVEINCHGGIIPMQRILKLVLQSGAIMAEPGEFTKRAFLNGRLDLAQAESVMDLISAKTPKGFDIAMKQLDGFLSEQVSNIRNELLSVMAQIEVGIDYPEEDIEDVTYAEILSSFKGIKDKINKLLKSSETGKIIRDGLTTVIVGKPNVGKSSLLNALLKESRAIVTDIPGTTRDVIEEYVNIKGIPLKIVDTAGIRETEDVVEKIGVEKSKEHFNKGDLIIFVLNAAEEMTEEDREIMSFIKDKQAIVVINKTDLPMKIDLSEVESIIGEKKIIKTSVMTRDGIEEVEDYISNMVYGGEVSIKDNPFVTNVRHITALENALSSIEDTIGATESGMPYDFIEVDVKNTIEYLGEIIGESIETDLVKKIFGNFCLGK